MNFGKFINWEKICEFEKKSWIQKRNHGFEIVKHLRIIHGFEKKSAFEKGSRIWRSSWKIKQNE